MRCILLVLATLSNSAAAEEPRVRFDSQGHLVWTDGTTGAVLDIDTGALVAGGPAAVIERDFPARPAEEPKPCGPQTGEADLLAVDGDSCVARDGTRLRVYSNGFRILRTDLPDWWGDRYTQTAFSVDRVVLYDGRTLLDIDGDRSQRTYDVGAGHAAMDFYSGRSWLAFSGRPGRIVDLFQERVIDLPELEVSDVAWRSDTVVGTIGSGESARAAVWDAEGDLRFVLDRPDYGTRRLSPDGRALGVLFVGEDERVAELLDTKTGAVRQNWSVCADGHRIWPVSADSIVDVCGDAVWLRGPLGSEAVGRFPGGTMALLERPIRNVTASDDGLRIVTGEGSHGLEVWTLALGGGPGTIAHQEHWEPVPGEDGETVQGYEDGTPRSLVIEDVEGTPVEVATARAYRRMARAAQRDGVTLAIASGFRTYAEQSALYDCYLSGDCNGGNLAASPGHSNHQSGLAPDLNTHVRSVRRWLEAHAKEYGFVRTVRSEPWHWEYVGGERQPAMSVAVLPPAEPAWKSPRTPWTATPDLPEPVPTPPVVESMEAIADVEPVRRTPFVDDPPADVFGEPAVPSSPEPRSEPEDPWASDPRNEPARRSRRRSRSLQSIFF